MLQESLPFAGSAEDAPGVALLHKESEKYLFSCLSHPLHPCSWDGPTTSGCPFSALLSYLLRSPEGKWDIDSS